jgi:murein DD-endopeptidase MepM/ murein hydrolase activator NlpD
MEAHPHQKLKQNRIAKRTRSFLYRKIAGLLPPMWYNNDIDKYHIIRDRVWFLKENRFLFFTRNGPVEITLKPTAVLASAIICMVGVSVIFLSTIFASYSAIEVIRDESIQPAEASIKSIDRNVQRTFLTTLGNGKSGNAVIQQRDITPHDDLPEANHAVVGKTATSPKPIISLFNTRPEVNAPSVVEILGNRSPHSHPTVAPMASTDNKQEAHQVSTTTIQSVATDSIDNKKGNIAEADAASSDLQSDESFPDLALATAPVEQYLETNLLTDRMPIQALDKTADGIITDAPTQTLHESNIAEYHSTEPAQEDGIVSTAAGFAIAMLPRLFKDSDSATPQSKQDTTDIMAFDGDDIAAGSLDDGFAANTYVSRTGPLLPSISDAARAQKMLLSLNGEIDYIRKSISQLGIKTDYLPRYEATKISTKDTDFKQLLITLAEHRAALRKIPFKTPMLYFYISSKYGYRKHPKTGKKTFHHGIDLAGTWQENVRSTAPGTVSFAGREGAFGKVVRIEHDFGVSTLYAHLSRITVSVGDYVAENTVIGKMGNTGRSAGPHLHYEIQVDGKSIDPNEFFTIGRQMSVSGELRQTSLTN